MEKSAFVWGPRVEATVIAVACVMGYEVGPHARASSDSRSRLLIMMLCLSLLLFRRLSIKQSVIKFFTFYFCAINIHYRFVEFFLS